ncbi:Origin recognition complex subunit 1 [Dirofilaria immitis]|nr:Origin recognition complex subunit 1 [Dirofilaria immitis]
MPHAGIEPATFCLLDRRSAPEPMRPYTVMGILGENWRLYVIKHFLKLFGFIVCRGFRGWVEKNTEIIDTESTLFSDHRKQILFQKMCTDKDMLWNEKSKNMISNSLVAKDEGNENTSNKKILPKRKAKSMGRGCFEEDVFILHSPPSKRNRSSMVPQQTKFFPTSNHGEGLNKVFCDAKSFEKNSKIVNLICPNVFGIFYLLQFGFEDEDEKSEGDSKMCNQKVTSEAWKPKKSPVWKQKIGVFDNNGHKNVQNTKVHSTVDFISGRASKNKSEKVNKCKENSIKRIDGLHLSNFKKPLIMLKRTEILAGAKFMDSKYDISERKFGDNDGDQDFEFSEISECFSRPDSDYKINSNFNSGKNRKIKKKSISNTIQSVISNIYPKISFSAQRVESLEAVYHRLHTSEIPERLPCREVEFELICTFIKECIANDAISQAMYISGVPGTGKTATVMQAVRHLKASENFSAFDFVMVNAMELSNPKQIFVEIYQHLFSLKKKIAPKTARKKLNDIFQYRDKNDCQLLF